ncbi:MAG: GNAT family N-acetyltransferase [Candidatus Omnitrophica bacterium]|nr:GNAT family N-acetyltransferase [Candidatus Omnitrophota bacterium]
MENALGQNYKELVLEKMKKLKYAPFGFTVQKCKLSGAEFEIILLTADCAKNIDLMDLLGKWRKENEQWYLSQFPVSVERTTKWFMGKLTEVPDRLLFIIKVSSKFIGHVGLFRFDFDNLTCEIDNILRGEGNYPGIMAASIKGMMAWAKSNLGLRGFTLKVLSDNPRAIKLYQKIGYREVTRIPLIQVDGQDGLEWIEAAQDYKGQAQRYYLVMSSC